MPKKRASRDGHIYQLPSGSWRAQIYVQGQRVSFSAKTQREVREWIRSTTDQVERGLTFSSLSVTVREFADNWLAASQTTLRPGSHTQYTQIFRDYIFPTLGAILIRELRPDQVQALYSSLQKQGKSAHLVRKIHTCLHACLEHARTLGTIFTNPAENLLLPAAPHQEMRILDQSEISSLLISVQGTRFEALLRVAIHTGMRQMELLGLRWDDLDWERKSIKIQRQLQRKKAGEEWKFVAPKTRAGKRTIYLGDQTIESLRRHYELQRLERAANKRWQNYGLIFPSLSGTPIHPRNLLADFKAILTRAVIPEIRFHDLRHTAASLMIESGLSILLVSRRLGHARPSITLDIYGHLMPESQARSADQLDELISPVEISELIDSSSPRISHDLTRLKRIK